MLSLMARRGRRQVMASHKMNIASSRSHAMLQLHLAVGRDGTTDNPVLSRLTLVDLAGSERTSQTGGTGAYPSPVKRERERV
jgi:hypothetical protein